MELYSNLKVRDEASPTYAKRPTPPEIEFMKTLYSIGVLGENRAALRLLEMILDDIPVEHRPRF